jgi:dTMP kinase
MEQQPADFYERVREGYRKVAEAHPERVKIVPASGTVEQVGEAVWREVEKTFSL